MFHKIPLRVVFINESRKVIKTHKSMCYLNNEHAMPYIVIRDLALVRKIMKRDNVMSITMPAYSVDADRFNFNPCTVFEILHTDCENPEITIEYLETNDGRYISLQPGLYKSNDKYVYRMCDDAMLHIIKDIFVTPSPSDTKSISPTFIDQFIDAHQHLNLSLIDEEVIEFENIDFDHGDKEITTDGISIRSKRRRNR